MKLAFVSDAIYPYNKGGKEKRLYEITSRLARMGHEVHIYTMHWWKTPAKSRIEDGVHLHAISKYYDMYNGETRSLKEAIMFSLACLKMVRAKFDVVDVDHMPFFPIFTMWFICLIKGKKLYGTWHEALSAKDWVSYMGKAGYVSAIIERVSTKLPYQISTASKHTTRLLGQYHNRTKRVATVELGIDTAFINAIKPAKIDCDVLYTGRFVKDKNVDLTIKAIGILAKDNPDIRAIVIGHGVEKPRLAALIKKLGVEEQVQLLGPLPHAADVYSYMKAAKVYSLPTNREGFGIVALEALGCNTPVVTSNAIANGAKDLITDGVNGSIVPATEYDIAKAIAHWISQPKKDIATSVAHYDWDNIANKQAKVYA